MMEDHTRKKLLTTALSERSEAAQQEERLAAVYALDQAGLLAFLQRFDWMNNPELFTAAYVRYRNQPALPSAVQKKWQELGSAEAHACARFAFSGGR
ncbi:hypothetical protein KJ611_03045 [Patescibacteria group bacterium]|nr:hypothetical protein [Patescibacteria group bacterium]MBU1705566.1 hypothetical protein [Patescibacteria group bacterium]